MLESKTDTIKRLIDQEKELYLVENFIECEGNMTNLWNLYNDKDNALRWPKLVKSWSSKLHPDYQSWEHEAIDDGKGHYIYEERYTNCGRQVYSYFVYTKIK